MYLIKFYKNICDCLQFWICSRRWRKTGEFFRLLSYYAWWGALKPTFRDNIGPVFKDKIVEEARIAWPWKMGLIRIPETSISNTSRLVIIIPFNSDGSLRYRGKSQPASIFCTLNLHPKCLRGWPVQIKYLYWKFIHVKRLANHLPHCRWFLVGLLPAKKRLTVMLQIFNL